MTGAGIGERGAVRPWRTRRGCALAVGDTVGEGDTISTGADTTALLMLFDGTTLALSGDSVLTLERLRASEYFGSLLHGKMQEGWLLSTNVLLQSGYAGVFTALVAVLLLRSADCRYGHRTPDRRRPKFVADHLRTSVWQTSHSSARYRAGGSHRALCPI